MMKRILVFSLLIISARVFSASDIEIQNPTIKVMPPNMTMTAILMTIKNNSDRDLQLLSADGSFAKSFELHTMETIDGKMKMRKVNSILIKKHSSTELKSGGYHVMVFDIKAPIKESAAYEATLVFDNKEKVIIKAKAVK